MKKILKKSLHILCTTLGIIPFMLSSCNYLAVDEYFNDLTPLYLCQTRLSGTLCMGNRGINARSRQLIFRFLRPLRDRSG